MKFAEALKVNKSLKKINLKNNSGCDNKEAVIAVFESLKMNRSITAIDMRDSSYLGDKYISYKVTEILTDILRTNANITSIKLACKLGYKEDLNSTLKNNFTFLEINLGSKEVKNYLKRNNEITRIPELKATELEILYNQLDNAINDEVSSVLRAEIRNRIKITLVKRVFDTFHEDKNNAYFDKSSYMHMMPIELLEKIFMCYNVSNLVDIIQKHDLIMIEKELSELVVKEQEINRHQVLQSTSYLESIRSALSPYITICNISAITAIVSAAMLYYLNPQLTMNAFSSTFGVNTNQTREL